ncbi:MAG: hypothetical protein ABEJ95_07335 [Candidatus Nanohalobium sp.]
MSGVVDSDFDWMVEGVRVKDRSRIKRAMEKQEEIRAESGEGGLSSEIRKWRDKRGERCCGVLVFVRS